MKKTNYHIHTYRCGHATGDIEDYVKYAREEKFTNIGFADHCPLPDEWWPEIRMKMNQLNDYLSKIEIENKKYNDISILKGLECDYLSRYENFFKEELLLKNGLDYLIGSVHCYVYKGEVWDIYHEDMTSSRMSAYADLYIKAMESKIFTFMAHPDLFLLKVDKWNSNSNACAKEIFQAAEELKIPLEINTSGYLKAKNGMIMYPRKEFWELASSYNLSVYVNTDAHTPELVGAHYEDGQKIAEQNNLKYGDIIQKHLGQI